VKEITALKKDLLRQVLLISIPAIVFLFLLGKYLIAASFGFGVLVSWLNFYLLSKDISKIHFFDSGASSKNLIKGYFLRYSMLVVVFSLAFLLKLHIIAFMVGFFKVKLLLVISQASKR